MSKLLDPEQYDSLHAIWRKLYCWGAFWRSEQTDWPKMQCIDIGYCLDRCLNEEPK